MERYIAECNLILLLIYIIIILLASEHRSWLLYFSLPVLHGLLQEPYFTHDTLFVAAIHMLLSAKLTHSNLRRASCYLDRFCQNLSGMNSNKNILCTVIFNEDDLIAGNDGCTMNVYLLRHIPDCVFNWDPLWYYSCFPFESINRCMNQQSAFTYIMNTFSFISSNSLLQDLKIK